MASRMAPWLRRRLFVEVSSWFMEDLYTYYVSREQENERQTYTVGMYVLFQMEDLILFRQQHLCLHGPRMHKCHRGS